MIAMIVMRVFKAFDLQGICMKKQMSTFVAIEPPLDKHVLDITTGICVVFGATFFLEEA